MAVKTAIPCLAAVEAYPRMAYRSRVVFSSEPAADLLLGLGGPQVAFGLVAGRGDGGVGQEPQHVGFAVPQASPGGAGPAAAWSWHPGCGGPGTARGDAAAE